MSKQQQSIQELTQALEKLGYYPHQIKEIYRECLGRSALGSLRAEETLAIIACLEEYIAFAQKCKRKKATGCPAPDREGCFTGN